MVKDEVGPAHGRGVVRDHRPTVLADVVHEEVALHVLRAVAHSLLQISAQDEDVPVLGVEDHLVTGAGAGAALELRVGRDQLPLIAVNVVAPEVVQVPVSVPAAEEINSLEKKKKKS